MTKYLTILLAALTFSSCLSNDIPYPVVKLEITGMTGDGFSVSSVDGVNRILTLTLDEATDIRKVQIDQVQFDVSAQNTTIDKQTFINQIRASRPLTGTFDLRTPIYVTLDLYQSYDWTIVAEQPMERLFAVAGQIGSTEFDIENHIATAHISMDADLTKVTVTALKLGPAQITDYSPTLAELTGSSFESARLVDVTCHGITEQWRLYVLPSDTSVSLRQADAGSEAIWLYGDGIIGSTMGFRYREAATAPDGAWTDVTDITVTGGSFEACIKVRPETAYELKAFCDEQESATLERTTGSVVQLPNSGFEQWSESNKIVYPYAADATPYWGTGNPGAKLASETLTDKGDPRPGSAGSYCANLKSKFANIAGAGKFAAGNLFTGAYIRTLGTDGLLSFGRTFTQRPTGLRIWVKYNRGNIDKLKDKPTGSDLELGMPDNGIVYVALGTWTPEEYGRVIDGTKVGTEDSPICICTKASSRILFDPKGKDVIGYGEYVMTESVPGWKEVVIPIVYNTTSVAPTNILVVCSASRWGDYFTGSTKSEMWVDDFELIYAPIKKETAE